jgi:nitroreductase
MGSSELQIQPIRTALASLPPPAPQFGDTLAIRPSPETLEFLAQRRSASALSLGEPGPSEAELRALLTLAVRVPDHGKLAPWRFVVLQGSGKRAFVQGLEAIAAARPDAAKLHAKLGKIRVPPLTVAVVSRVVEGEIPAWEQRLSAGAVCAILIIAAQAMGYGANWITDWYAYDDEAAGLLGLGEGEQVAGFVHLGTASEAPLERVRPHLQALITNWAP